MSDDLIDPSSIVIPQVKPDELEAAASDIRKQGGKIAESGQDIKSSWSGLASCYTAPEDETLLSVVDPVADKGDEIDDDLGEVASALETFAEEARSLKAKLEAAKEDAKDFVASVEGDDSWAIADFFGYPSEKMQEHNALLDRVSVLMHQYQEAERECANKITSLFKGGTTFIGAGAQGPGGLGKHEKIYGTDKPLANEPTPWGAPQGSDFFPFVDFKLGQSEYEMNSLEDIGSMTGFYSEDGWGVDSKDEWLENIGTNALNTVAGAGAMAGVWNLKTGDWTKNGNELNVATTAWKNAAHGIVPWTEWEERPGYVAGVTYENVKSIGSGIALSFVPGLNGVGIAMTGTRVARIMGGLGRGDGHFSPDGGSSPELDVNDAADGGNGDRGRRPDLTPGSGTDGGMEPPAEIKSGPGFDFSEIGDMNESLGDLEDAQRPAPRWQPEPEPAPDSTPDPAPVQDAPTRPTPEGDQSPESVPDQQDAPEPEPTPERPAEQDPSRLDPTAEEVDENFAEMARRNEDLGNTMDAEDGGRMAELDGEDPWSIEALKDPEGDGGRGGPDEDAQVPVTPDGMEMSHYEPGDGNEGSGGDPSSLNQDGDSGRVEVTEDQSSEGGQKTHGSGHGSSGPPPPPSGGGPSWPDPDDRIDPSSPDPDPLNREQPGNPMLDSQEPDLRQLLKTNGVNGQKIDEIVTALKNPDHGHSVGKQVADILLNGRVVKVDNFSDFVTKFSQDQQRTQLEYAAELRFLDHLIDKGYPINRLEFAVDPPNKSEPYDIDTFVRSGQVEDYAYQVKRLEVKDSGLTESSQLVNNSQKIGQQLRAVNGWGGHRGVGIMEANAPLEGLTEKQYKKIVTNAQKYDIVYKIYTPTGSFTVPPGAKIFPSVLGG